MKNRINFPENFRERFTKSSHIKELPKTKIQIEFTEENIHKLFGHEAAEDEEIESLLKYYFQTDTYEQVSADLKLRILVGHKGVGKSALFKVLVNQDLKKNILPIEIKPNEIFNIANSEENFYSLIEKWKDGIKEIIINKTIEKFVDDQCQKFLPKSGTIGKNIINSILEIINSKSDKITNKTFYNTFQKNQKLNIYIDDLDRGWKGNHEDITLLSTLLNAIRDISNENTNVNFKIALRTDVYYLVRTSDESTDKIEGSVVWLTWKNHEILALLIKRINNFLGRDKTDSELMKLPQNELATYLKEVMTEYFEGQGKWDNTPIYRVLMSLIRKRPRDLVKLCTLAAKEAKKRNSNRIETQDFQNIFEEYSLNRLQDTVNEFRSEFHEIENLLLSLRPSSKHARKYTEQYVYNTEDLLKKLTNVSQNQNWCFSNSSKKATPNELLTFLYKIGFLTARKVNKDKKIIRKTFEENKYLTKPTNIYSFGWEIHPAYRWALEPDDPAVIYEKLEINTEWE